MPGLIPPLFFHERFWKDENFDMVTDPTPHYFYHGKKNQSSKKGVLISNSIGEKAAVVENQSNEWRVEMIHQTLKPYFGNIISKIEKQFNYYWDNDPLLHGVYALYGKGQWFRLMPVFKRPHIHITLPESTRLTGRGLWKEQLIPGKKRQVKYKVILKFHYNRLNDHGFQVTNSHILP